MSEPRVTGDPRNRINTSAADRPHRVRPAKAVRIRQSRSTRMPLQFNRGRHAPQQAGGSSSSSVSSSAAAQEGQPLYADAHAASWLNSSLNDDARGILDTCEELAHEAMPEHDITVSDTVYWDGLTNDQADALIDALPEGMADDRVSEGAPSLRNLVTLMENHPSMEIYGYRLKPGQPGVESVIAEGFYIPECDVKADLMVELHRFRQPDICMIAGATDMANWLKLEWEAQPLSNRTPSGAATPIADSQFANIGKEIVEDLSVQRAYFVKPASGVGEMNIVYATAEESFEQAVGDDYQFAGLMLEREPGESIEAFYERCDARLDSAHPDIDAIVSKRITESMDTVMNLLTAAHTTGNQIENVLRAMPPDQLLQTAVKMTDILATIAGVRQPASFDEDGEEFDSALECAFSARADAINDAEMLLDKLGVGTVNDLPDGLPRYADPQLNLFVRQMYNAGLKPYHYHGRAYWQGPAVNVKNAGEYAMAISLTSIPCRCDQMGLGYVIYPLNRGDLLEEPGDDNGSV